MRLPDPPARPWYYKKRFVIPAAVFALMVFVAIVDDTPPTATEAAEVSEPTPEPTPTPAEEPTEEPDPEPTVEPEPEPTEEPTPEPEPTEEPESEDAESVITEMFGDKLRHYSEQDGHVTVIFDGEGNATTMMLQAADVFEAFYMDPDSTYNEVAVTVQRELIDTYGNTEERDGLVAILDRETIERINWDMKRALDWSEVLHEAFLHPAFD